MCLQVDSKFKAVVQKQRTQIVVGELLLAMLLCSCSLCCSVCCLWQAASMTMQKGAGLRARS